MNYKINTICFILLLFLLIGAVSAIDNENETISSTIQPDPTQEISVEHIESDEIDELQTVDEIDEDSPKEVLKATKTKKEKVTLKAPNVSMYYKDGHKFTVTLKNKNNKAINKAKIKIKINGETYSKVTNAKGTASMNLNLKSGSYVVLSTFDGSGQYDKASVKSTVTIKSTLKCGDLTKYYKNTAPYSSTFYDAKGKVLKSTAVKFKLDGKTYSVKTDSKGVAKLNVDLKPGKYAISVTNSKTSETISKTVTVKTLIETKNLVMKDGDKSKFGVKVLNSNGKVNPNQKVTFKVNGETLTKTTDKNGYACFEVDLDPGKYSITTEYNGLKNTNQITVNVVIRHSEFSHITMIPNYVNVTTPYVFHNSTYSLKTGADGIIKLPKNDIFILSTADGKIHTFSLAAISGIDTNVIGDKIYLVPFDGNDLKSSYNKEDLKGDGILISSGENYTNIEYRSTSKYAADLFGVYYDKGNKFGETVTYMQNDEIKAQMLFTTYSYDETGLQLNLAKYYGKSYYQFYFKTYDEVTNHNADKIKFADTNESVKFDNNGYTISTNSTHENIVTKFIVNGKEELEKTEKLSYGNSEKYRRTYGFEVLQSYAVINTKVNKDILESWLSLSPIYMIRYGITNVYGMFMTALETAWIADETAGDYAKQFNVKWKRGKTLTILGGITLDDTYLNILDADMGMTVTGKDTSCALFRLINSLNLPNIEQYALLPISEKFGENSTNSLENIVSAFANNNYSIAQLGEMMYIFDENSSAIVLNTTSGVSSVIYASNNNVYKGSKISTNCDCCSITAMTLEVIEGVMKALNDAKSILQKVSDHLVSLAFLSNKALKQAVKIAMNGVSSPASTLLTTMLLVQEYGVSYREVMVDQKDWHETMDRYTFTRSGAMQGKKVFNIPNKDGGYDYIEVKINDDGSLDRTRAIYISNGKTRNLTKEETYQYFTYDTWTPFSMPAKYWDKSWEGITNIKHDPQ